MATLGYLDDHPSASTSPGRLLDELMTAREVADTLRLRVSTVEAYARRGLLPSVKLGRHRRFIKSDVERAITLLQSQLPPAAQGREPPISVARMTVGRGRQ
jgi:excisionase family DNA binding protein